METQLERAIGRTKSKQKRARHILVAEDEPAIQNLLKYSLIKLGYKVTCADNGREVIDLTDANPNEYDLILLDAMMPRLSGFEVCKRLRNTPAFELVPILVLTAMSDAQARVRAYELGANDFLTKPLNRAELATRIDHQLKVRDYDLLQKEYANNLEREVEELYQMIFHAERLAFLGTLAGGVGHELNNLTTILQTTVHLLKDDLQKGQTIDVETVPELEGVLKHLRNHGEQLLNLGRPPTENGDTSDLESVLQHCLRVLYLAGRTKFIEVEVVSNEDRPWVDIPKTRLEQVLLNLVGNAADAITETDRTDGKISILVSTSEQQVRVAIKDNGCGLDDTGKEHLFDAYYTTKEQDKGTGLGLLVVQQILFHIGGTLEFQSSLGAGSVFVVTLDRALC